MEDIIKQLKKLQHIEPDRLFTERSRAALFGVQKSRGTWGLILRNVELGASFALAGILIITIFGGFSTWRFLSPFKLSNLDTTGLKAEAQAVDVQIELTNLNYDEIINTVNLESTESVSALVKNKGKSAPLPLFEQEEGNVTEGSVTEAEEISDTISIEEALEMLAK